MNHASVRNLLVLACVTAVLTACAPSKSHSAAQKSQTAATVSRAAPVPARHFLWRVSKGHKTLYLAGSVHALSPHDYPLPPVMENAFQHSLVLVEEINLATIDVGRTQSEARRLGRYPPGQSLRKVLPPHLYTRVVNRAKQLGIDTKRLDRLRPWLASVAILHALLSQTGYKSRYGVDRHFADEARKYGKRIVGLETPDFQLQLLASLPEKVQRDMLLQSLDQADHFNREMHDLISAWTTGNTAALEKILKQEFGNHPLTYKLLIANRNRDWMPRLLRLLRNHSSCFVVVGALHLVGPQGLLALFEKAGFKVQQL